jgi:hypothetical protein
LVPVAAAYDSILSGHNYLTTKFVSSDIVLFTATYHI